MESFVFALNAVAPIILMVAVGYWLKKVGLMKGDFAKAANKLVFRVFLPSMLFLNVYKIDSLGELEFGYIIYVFVHIFIANLANTFPSFIVLLNALPQSRIVFTSPRTYFFLKAVSLLNFFLKAFPSSNGFLLSEYSI